MTPVKCPMCSSDLLTADRIEQMFAKEQEMLVDGKSQDINGQLDIDPVKLVKKLVLAVVNHGQQHILWEFPELLEFMKSRIPSRAELAGHTGVDERMFEAKAKWPNVDQGSFL